MMQWQWGQLHAELVHDILPLQALPDVDHQALAREQIDHREHAQLAAVEQGVGHADG